MVFLQPFLSGFCLKSALGLIEVVIGSIVEYENPHGFSAFILTKYEFWVVPPVAPHEVESK